MAEGQDRADHRQNRPRSHTIVSRRGATVIVTGANPVNVATVAAEFGIEAIQSDGSDRAAITALMTTIRDRQGRLDILFANAGYGEMRPIAAVDPAYFDKDVWP